LRHIPAILLLALAACDSKAASRAVPPPPAEAARSADPAVAILAGGCFWGMEGVFERVRGVTSVVSGYAGGTKESANYAAVSSETTRHAEVVRIAYDPAKVSYGTLLQIYFAVAHDPTQVNRQGPDVGPSYRSAIFPQGPGQERMARSYIAQLNRAGVFTRPIATRIERGAFYRAESSHQDFMRRNPRHPYILAHDVPKVRALKRQFPQYWRD
jgi:peptide-methionine (S)-S-oxide reductase